MCRIKTLLVVIDGLGDRPIAEFENKTPLAYAKTPFLDSLASKSQCGLLSAVGKFKRPSSDVAHMAIFGLDYINQYPGRGPIELAGLDTKFSSNDLALRGNFAHFSKEGKILDRRAYRLTPSKKLLSAISPIEIDGVIFNVHHIAEHRFALQISGPNLSSAISNNDPHFEGVCADLIEPLNSKRNSQYTADVLNKYIKRVNAMLSELNENSVNGILLRSAGFPPNWPSFYNTYGLKASCITNNALYNGIGRLLGMKVILSKRFKDYTEYYKTIPVLLEQALDESDFVFLHFQETDLFGEDGDHNKKKDVIEKIDAAISCVESYNNDLCTVVTADHSTPCSLKGHSGDPVPFMICCKGNRFDSVNVFSEFACGFGSLGHLEGKDVMPLILNVTNNSKLIGG